MKPPPENPGRFNEQLVLLRDSARHWLENPAIQTSHMEDAVSRTHVHWSDDQFRSD
jgi:hypothetical protein